MGHLPSAKTDRSSSDLEPRVLQIIRENPQAVSEAIQLYQQRQQAEARKSAESKRKQVFANVSALIGTSPTLGSPDRNLILVVFSDFQCPFCARTQQTLRSFMKAHGAEVTLVYKHLPLTEIHPEATSAALSSGAAAQQGKFWQYHDALFQNQDRLGEALYVEIAKTLKLDLQQFERDRHSEASKAALRDDETLSKRIEVNGTPYFLLNGIEISGASTISEFNATEIRKGKSYKA